MTPPVQQLSALQVGPTAETATRPLTPAPKPQAVLVPPLVMSLVALLVTTAAEAASAGTSILRIDGRGVLLTLAALVPNAVVLTWARAHGSRLGILVAPANGIVFALLAVWALRGSEIPAGVVVAACAGGFLAPALWRPWQDLWMANRVERVSLLAPTTLGAFEAICRLEAVPWVRVSSVVVPDGDPELATRLLKRPVVAVLGGEVALERRVIVSCPIRDPAVGRSIAELVARGHDLTSESATLRNAEGRVDTSRADPLNLLMGRRRSRLQDAASRFLDIVLSSFFLIVGAPLLLACAIAVVVDSGFPVFYRQRRVGRGGRPLYVVKFRSMRQDAERVSGPVWATEDDPRITAVGRILRRYRLDELPQLWNVLVGDMALVGPRPERPHFCEVLRDQVPLFELRTIVRPGLTGWAQVRLAYSSTHDEARAKLEYDLYYVTHRSPWFDLAVLAETARVVLKGDGAR